MCHVLCVKCHMSPVTCLEKNLQAFFLNKKNIYKKKIYIKKKYIFSKNLDKVLELSTGPSFYSVHDNMM